MILKPSCRHVNFVQRLLSSTPWQNITKASKTVKVSNSAECIFSTGELARFADGSAHVQIGNTAVLAVVVWRPPEDQFASSFLPLNVQFRQQLASLGRIPLSFDRRDRHDSPTEILTGRLIDRCIRPVFLAQYYPKVEVTCSVLADDHSFDPDIAAINAASLALGISTMPGFNPVGAVRVALDSNGVDMIVNPTRFQRYQSDIDLVISADIKGNITAIQSACNMASKDAFVEALKLGTASATELANQITSFVSEFGKNKEAIKTSQESVNALEKLSSEIYFKCESDLLKIFSDSSHTKTSRDNAIKEVRGKVFDELREQSNGPDDEMQEQSNIFSTTSHQSDDQFSSAFVSAVGKTLKKLAFEEKKRCDGRELDDIRNIVCDTNIYPALHGSALFCRGQTQVLCRLAFDSLSSSQKLDPLTASIKGQLRKYFMLHYQFPKYSINDFSAGKGDANRRELGHGNLAEMGIAPVVPKDYKFAIRLLAEVLESNGSTSMASVCAASLALMDAGVDITEPAAGIAIGLLTERDPTDSSIKHHTLLTDILGFEDFFGEMDFKIAGTKSGCITAVQCDVKKYGIPVEVAVEAVTKGLGAIYRVISKMDEALDSPRNVEALPSIPKVKEFAVPRYQVGAIFGPGRLNVKHFEDLGCVFTASSDDILTVFAPNQKLLDLVSASLEDRIVSMKEPVLQFGQICNSKIEKVTDKGVYVTIFQGQVPIFIPNSQLDSKNILHPSAIGLSEGKTMKVKFFGRDPANGRMRLSRRALLVSASELPSVDFVSER